MSKRYDICNANRRVMNFVVAHVISILLLMENKSLSSNMGAFSGKSPGESPPLKAVEKDDYKTDHEVRFV